MRSLLSLFVLFAVVFSLGLSVKADEICDGLEGAAFGLCNAYCKACGCDGEPAPSTKKCEKLQANYEKITGELPPYDPCFGIICEESSMCVDGECTCESNSDCALLEDCNVDGVCEDPCATLADVAECPCSYLSLIPQTEDCWGFENGPEFNTNSDFCFTQNFVLTMDPIPTEMTTYIGSAVGAFGVGFDCTMRIVGNPSCSAVDLDTNIVLNLTQYTTCNCRVEQYTNKLADQPWAPTFIGEQPPFTCLN